MADKFEDFYTTGNRFVAIVSELSEDCLERASYEITPFTSESFKIADAWAKQAMEDYSDGHDVDIFGTEYIQCAEGNWLDICIVPIELYFYECYDVRAVRQEF